MRWLDDPDRLRMPRHARAPTMGAPASAGDAGAQRCRFCSAALTYTSGAFQLIATSLLA